MVLNTCWLWGFDHLTLDPECRFEGGMFKNCFELRGDGGDTGRSIAVGHHEEE